MKPEQVGTCATCAHFTPTTDDERRGEVLPGEHEDFRSPGTCPYEGDVLGLDTCVGWTRMVAREEV